MIDARLSDVGSYIQEVTKALAELDQQPFERILELLMAAYVDDRSIYIFGNGGSAALASHLACDLAKNVTFNNGSRRLRALSLTDNVPLMSAWANDVGYESVFVEQLRNFLTEADIVIAISGSGKSPNVLRALEFARGIGATAIGITGRDGGKMVALCDPCLIVPSHNMLVIEDLHTITTHIIATGLYARISNISSDQVTGASPSAARMGCGKV